MKKSFLKRVSPVMIGALAAVIGLMTAGCGQDASVIEDAQNAQNAQNATPVASDFTVIGLSATADGSPKTVSIKPKTGKSQGTITVYYEGVSGLVYPKSAASPRAAGKYAVTFDVAESEGFNAANGLKAGTLTISEKTSDNVENEDGDLTDDGDNEEAPEKPAEENPEEISGGADDETAEEIIEPFLLVDFEDAAWKGTVYAKRKVTWGGFEWTVSGVVTTNTGDHKDGNMCVRLRGNSSDKGDNSSRVELNDYLSRGIESISFDYASYSNHSGGTLILYYLKEDGEEWEEAGRIEKIPSWNDGGGKLLNAVFTLNISGNARFKIEKASASGNTSVNVDNIIITYLQ